MNIRNPYFRHLDVTGNTHVVLLNHVREFHSEGDYLFFVVDGCARSIYDPDQIILQHFVDSFNEIYTQ